MGVLSGYDNGGPPLANAAAREQREQFQERWRAPVTISWSPEWPGRSERWQSWRQGLLAPSSALRRSFQPLWWTPSLRVLFPCTVASFRKQQRCTGRGQVFESPGHGQWLDFHTPLKRENQSARATLPSGSASTYAGHFRFPSPPPFTRAGESARAHYLVEGRHRRGKAPLYIACCDIFFASPTGFLVLLFCRSPAHQRRGLYSGRSGCRRSRDVFAQIFRPGSLYENRPQKGHVKDTSHLASPGQIQASEAPKLRRATISWPAPGG